MRSSTILLTTTVASVVLYVAAAGALGTPPDATAAGDEVVAWFAAHGSAVRTYVWCLTLLAPVAGVSVALVRERLPRPYRDVYFLGGVTFVAETAVVGWIWGALSAHQGMLEAGTARALLDVAAFWGPVLTGSTVTMLAPVVVATARGALALPRWLTVLGAVALVEQIVETITVFGRTGFTAPGGPMNLYLGAVLTLAWFAALGIVLARRGDAGVAAAPAAGTAVEPVR
ncbi:hypothetical protein Acsp06_04560 [Actinomycetospora sp. NBRC 106375]|uniref:hypothetical protein n=1 Tax=Actinomycetospora sp. NBRC 106375 TaxID=3032207 RepID=UPI0024A0DE10|nr:hypothetical protein [Actinomycetospora sp. NBRC 106375]GLZ44271.1 hypothetical protein Acsp06_04560 [Actinomycetospora sp. NBRC 106375]